jgi:hypothetical protein
MGSALCVSPEHEVAAGEVVVIGGEAGIVFARHLRCYCRDAAALVTAASGAGTRRIWNGVLLMTPSTSDDQR